MLIKLYFLGIINESFLFLYILTKNKFCAKIYKYWTETYLETLTEIIKNDDSN